MADLAPDVEDPMTASQLNIEQPAQLLDYLHRQQLISASEQLRFQTLSGGVSNRAVLVQLESGTEWVIKQALTKLRVAVDWYSDPARIHSEAKALRALDQLGPPGTIPPFIYEDHAEHLLIMGAVPQPHENWKTILLQGHLQMDHVKQFAGLLATIHQRSAEQTTLLSNLFDDRTFFESLRLEPYYLYSAIRVPLAASFIKQLCDETRQRRFALVHGDYSPKNILIRHDKIVLLDHEVVHWGDPAFDPGFALTHFLSKAHHLAEQRNDFAEAARLFWSQYQHNLVDEIFGADFEQYVVRHTLGCLLARVAGRSPLEYLNEQKRALQLKVICSLLEKQLHSVSQLTDEFLKGIKAND